MVPDACALQICSYIGMEYLLLGEPHEVGGLELLVPACDSSAVFVEHVAIYTKEERGSGDILRVRPISEVNHPSCRCYMVKKLVSMHCLCM